MDKDSLQRTGIGERTNLMPGYFGQPRDTCETHTAERKSETHRAKKSASLALCRE